MSRPRLLSLLGTAALLASAARPGSAQPLDSTSVAGFRWRTVGPANFMGRLSDVVGIPGPSKTLYVAAAAGGIWKTTNNGITWRPLFDDKRVISMGMLAIAPTDTNTVWAGTGEPNSRNSIEPGAGVYKSTDGGTSWTLMGLEATQHIGRVVVDPRNKDVVYVAALGAAWKPNKERGLYKTTDGGKTWAMVKHVSDRAGFVDVALDPRNPDVLYAASYERYRTPYSLNSGGPGSALWKSTDAGATWTELKGNGFPEGTKGRIGLAVAPSNPNVVYAMVEAWSEAAGVKVVGGQRPQANGLYRSTDAGKTWQRMNSINVRPFYYSQVIVDPKNADRVYFSSTELQVSNDGGKTSTNAAQGVHVDDHGIWIDPNDPERWVLATDGGPAFTYDKGGNFFYPMNLPIGQFYEVSYDYAVPYNICGGAQDNGSWCGPSKRRAGVSNNNWVTIAGGDGFYTAQDPQGDWVWGESQNAGVQARNLKTGQTLRVTKPTWQERWRKWEDSIATLRGDPLQPASAQTTQRIAAIRTQQAKDSAADIVRFNWNSPFFLSPHNPNVFYLGGSKVLKSLKRGEELFVISPDLSKQMRARMDTAEKYTGGVTPDVTGAETYGTVVTLAESYIKPGLLLAGTDDGNVFITHNDGGQWENLSDRFPGLPGKDVYVTRVEPSHFDTLTFYVAFDNHRWNDFTPYLYMTEDGGKSFRSIVANLPKTSPADYLHVIREDPHNRDLLFVGSSLSVYASLDRGKTWTKFAAGLPSTPVYDLKIHPRDRELIAATHGRGFWIVDISGLEQMTPKAMADAATLFAPRTAFQWGEGPAQGLPGNGWGQHLLVFQNQPYGASISYRLKDSAATAPRITVSDASGAQLFTAPGPGRAGVHTVVWPFTTPAPTRVLSAAERRDSILLRARAPMVFDSLRKAGYDTLAIARVRTQVNQLVNPPAAGAGFGGRGGGGGGGGGGAGGRAGANVPGCEHPVTQWDAFCARPAEPVPQRGGPGGRDTTATGEGGGGVGAGAANAGRAGGASATLDPAVRIWELIGVRAPATGRGAGGGGFGGLARLAEPGSYVVTLTVGGQTLKQTFRVERVGTGDDLTAAPELIIEDDEEAESLNGGILPKAVNPFARRQ